MAPTPGGLEWHGHSVQMAPTTIQMWVCAGRQSADGTSSQLSRPRHGWREFAIAAGLRAAPFRRVSSSVGLPGDRKSTGDGLD